MFQREAPLSQRKTIRTHGRAACEALSIICECDVEPSPSRIFAVNQRNGQTRDEMLWNAEVSTELRRQGPVISRSEVVHRLDADDLRCGVVDARIGLQVGYQASHLGVLIRQITSPPVSEH